MNHIFWRDIPPLRYECFTKPVCDHRSLSLKPIFSLLFFKHGYLGEYLSYRYEFFNRCQNHSYAGETVSLRLKIYDFSLRA